MRPRDGCCFGPAVGQLLGVGAGFLPAWWVFRVKVSVIASLNRLCLNAARERTLGASMAEEAEGRDTGAEAVASGVDPVGVALALGFVGFMLCSCSAPGESAGQSASLFGSSCKPFAPDVTNSCIISSERWSEIPELPEPPGLYRYCAWPAPLSGAYRTRYRDVDGTVHDFTEAPVMTPSFLLEALKGVDNSPATELIDYRMMPITHPCPNEPPGQPDSDILSPRIAGGNYLFNLSHPPRHMPG